MRRIDPLDASARCIGHARGVQPGSFDLNLLLALDALLAESSVTRAADRLRVGQPAMSATLGRLRQVFNDPLLVRSGRSLVLTPFAQALREPVAAVIAQVDTIINLGSTFDPATDDRAFTIVASDYVALVLLRPLIERLQTTAPRVQIRVRPVDDSDVSTRLGRGEADLAVAPNEFLPPGADVRTERLFEDRFVCVVDAANPAPDAADLATFSRTPYLVSNQGVRPSLVEARLDALGVSRNVEVVANSFVMAPFLLPGTRLVTVIQRRLAHLLMGDVSTFRTFDPPVDLGPLVELMIWSPRQDADTGHQWLRAQIRALAEHISVSMPVMAPMPTSVSSAPWPPPTVSRTP